MGNPLVDVDHVPNALGCRFTVASGCRGACSRSKGAPQRSPTPNEPFSSLHDSGFPFPWAPCRFPVTCSAFPSPLFPMPGSNFPVLRGPRADSLSHVYPFSGFPFPREPMPNHRHLLLVPASDFPFPRGPGPSPCPLLSDSRFRFPRPSWDRCRFPVTCLRFPYPIARSLQSKCPFPAPVS